MELFGNNDYGIDSCASEDDVVSPLESSQISNSTHQRKDYILMYGIISLYIIIKHLVDVGVHSRRMILMYF